MEGGSKDLPVGSKPSTLKLEEFFAQEQERLAQRQSPYYFPLFTDTNHRLLFNSTT